MISAPPDDEHYMRLAMREAEKARAVGEVPCGCVIVRNGSVIARGWNQVETLKDATAHAEMLALTAAEAAVGDRRLEGCTVYVTKEPCPMCAGALVHCRPDRVVFGIPDPKGGACGGWINLLDSNPPLNHRCDVQGGVLADACLEQFRSFFRAARAAAKERKLAARAAAEAADQLPPSPSAENSPGQPASATGGPDTLGGLAPSAGPAAHG